MSHRTHRQRLARLYAAATGVPYQAALARIRAAADAGLLSGPLDPDGMAAALQRLLAEDRQGATATDPGTADTPATPQQICRVEFWQPMRTQRWGPPPTRERITITHPGPCHVGLGLVFATRNTEFPDTYTGYWALRRAIEWAYGLDEFDDLIPVAEPLLVRPCTVDTYFVEMTRTEREAAATILNEAADYWDLCDYATTSEGDEEDTLLGLLPLKAAMTCDRRDTTRTVEPAPEDPVPTG